MTTEWSAKDFYDPGLIIRPEPPTVVPWYKGWFGLCPVWIRFVEDDGVEFDLRYPFTGWLFWLSDHMMRAAIFCYSAINPDWEPKWPIRITDPDYDPDDP